MKNWHSAILVSLMLAGQPVGAQSIEEQVTDQLSAQGYTSFTTGRTWLGRVRVVGTSPTHEREVIIHPTTGAVLFDERRSLDGDDDDNRRVPFLGDDDEDDRDFDEDHDEDDEDDDEDGDDDEDDEDDEDDDEEEDEDDEDHDHDDGDDDDDDDGDDDDGDDDDDE